MTRLGIVLGLAAMLISAPAFAAPAKKARTIHVPRIEIVSKLQTPQAFIVLPARGHKYQPRALAKPLTRRILRDVKRKPF